MELIEEIKLSKTETLKLYYERCVKPGIGEYDGLFWKYSDGELDISIDSSMVTSLMVAKAFKKFSGNLLKKIL